MDECCNAKQTELQSLSERHRRVLWYVLAINIAMFLIEGTYGVIARSTALLADSLDMLGDAFVYAISIYAIGRSTRWNASIALIKGTVMAVFGIGVIAQAFFRFLSPSVPVAETMGIVGGLALGANIICATLLMRHRHDDINMRSTWLCSRNDVIANIGVLIAAGSVAITESKYPDLLVGAAISLLVLRSSFSVLRESLREFRT